MNPIHILVAEDDVNIRTGLIDTLESEGYQVTAARDGNEALSMFETHDFQLVILDVMMPGKSGFDLCRIIRARTEDMPIIMLTAKGEEIDKVLGLRLGADDYITKPFGVHELLARIAAVLRRCRPAPADKVQNQSDSFCIGGRTIHARNYTLEKNGETLPLSDREVKLLRLFYDHPDEVLSRDRLLNDIWGIDYYGTTRTLDQHVAQLRKKIEDDPANPKIITTVHGVGYRYRRNDMNDLLNKVSD
ncbi:MAG: response regulator transcription factor [Proteobacteria bacterium]|nr:response regulator transcription factor [Pseudomonadota bacterium]